MGTFQIVLATVGLITLVISLWQICSIWHELSAYRREKELALLEGCLKHGFHIIMTQEARDCHNELIRVIAELKKN